MIEPRKKRKSFFDLLLKHKGYFVLIFFFIFLGTFSLLYFFGLVPSEIEVLSDYSKSVTSNNISAGEFPVRIEIESIGVNAPILNPQSTEANLLDADLQKGAVHYPGSSLPGEGNTFLFGHSSSLSVVNNQAYKTFNNFPKLKSGDLIAVFSEKKEYHYRVNNVKLVPADKALVELGTSRKMLTLSTCNTFGKKEDRYVVEADYVGSTPILVEKNQ